MFCHDVGVPFIFNKIVYLQNVWVVEAFKVEEFLLQRDLIEFFLFDDFYGADLPCFLMCGFPNLKFVIFYVRWFMKSKIFFDEFVRGDLLIISK